MAVEIAEVRDDDRLLDIGTGTAGLLRVLSRRSRPREVVGVDVSSRMLERAPRLPTGWRLVRADARALPFEDGRFTAVAATYLLHLLEPRARAALLAEVRRVLVAGGRLTTVTPAAHRSGLGFPWAVAAVTLRRVAPSVFAGLQPLDPRADLAAAGFDVELVRRVSLGYPSLCVRARAR